MDRKKFSITDFGQCKRTGRKITVLTACDYPMASVLERAGIDCILVGDSLGMVELGYDSTVPVTMDEMVHHSAAVRRGTRYAFLVADMPFMSYQSSSRDAIKNAGRFIKEAGCDAVKLEGGTEDIAKIVKAVVSVGIPVMGHIGLTPQSTTALGGYRVQGKDADAARRLVAEAKLLERAGAFSIVLECVPDKVAGLITDEVGIPTIGIGAGRYCDGQVLVTHDILGIFDRFTPKFVKRYADISALALDGVKKYIDEVTSGRFPDDEHSFTIKDEEFKKLRGS